MTVPVIHKTKDFSIFKSVKFNREKNKRHIEQVKNIILKENLLHLHPILVNEEMEVIDGQHRLEAAKELGLEVYYIRDRISYEHILNSNLFQKKLVLEDVVKFYAMKDGISSYLKLLEYINELEISTKAIIGLMFGSVSIALIDFIKSGKFDLPSNQIILDKVVLNFKRFKDFAKEKRISPIAMFGSCNFTIAYRNLVLLSEFREDIWWKKLDQRWFDLKPQLNAKEWTRQLIEIYNWKNHNPINNDNA